MFADACDVSSERTVRHVFEILSRRWGDFAFWLACWWFIGHLDGAISQVLEECLGSGSRTKTSEHWVPSDIYDIANHRIYIYICIHTHMIYTKESNKHNDLAYNSYK